MQVCGLEFDTVEYGLCRSGALNMHVHLHGAKLQKLIHEQAVGLQPFVVYEKSCTQLPVTEVIKKLIVKLC